MRAGELRERIDLQSNTPTRNSFGDEVEQWVTTARVWAKVTATSGNEQINQAAGVVTTVYLITIRARSDVTPGMRVKYGDLAFDIKAVIDGSDAGSMVLDCRLATRGAA